MDSTNTTSAEELIARTAAQRVVVIGGGIGGLVAARECAKVGMHVTILEPSGSLGGVIRTGTLDGVRVDVGSDSFVDTDGHVRALLKELDLSDQITQATAGEMMLAGLHGTVPLPAGTYLGIPLNPFPDDVRGIIGWSGAWRAYVDRLRPPLTIGHERSLGKLVASRMGARVRDLLVAPVVASKYGAHPDHLDVDLVAPGLNAALTRTGSLSGAAAVLGAEPAAVQESLIGGMGALVEALLKDLLHLGADIRRDVNIQSLTRADAGWMVVAECTEGEVADDQTTAEIPADAVIVAVTEAEAKRVLGGIVTFPEDSLSVSVDSVTMLLDAPAMASTPTEILVVPGARAAANVVRQGSRWPWLRDAVGGREVVRVTFDPATATPMADGDAAVRAARDEVAALFGVTLETAKLIAAERAKTTRAMASACIGAAEVRTEAGAAVRAVPGLAVVGGWLAGAELAEVLVHAKSEADQLRRSMLWGSAAGD